MKRKGRFTKSPKRSRRIKKRWQWFWRLSWKRKLALVSVPPILFLILVPIVTYLILSRDISDPERLMNRNNTGIELLDMDGQVFYASGTSAPLKRLKLTDISKVTLEAIVSSEDKDFYKHSGVSLKGLLGALYANFTSKDATAYGGSTITQQLVKNTLLTNDKTFFRKYQEVAMAIAVDRQYGKDEILDMYINSVYFGEGAFGIDAAAHLYFGKEAGDLTLAEASMLVGLLPAPSVYSPISGGRAKAKKQQERVLRRMVEDGKIKETDKQVALSTELQFVSTQAQTPTVAPHFVEMVIAELNKKYGEETVKRSGYQVRTTLNLSWQKQADEIVAEQTGINARSGGRNAALVAIDPKNGEIRALVGSADYNNPDWGKFNVTISPRQPGSSFKPIYFTEALNQRIVTPATILRDEATDFNGYKPNNYDYKFRGDISVRNALAQSLNIPAVIVLDKLGINAAVETAQRVGLSTIKPDNNYGLSLALGAAEVTPVELTNAYAAFAHGGNQFETTTIQTIQNKYGETIYTHAPKDKRVQSEQASYLISNILSDNSARAPTFGSSLNIAGRTVAVKTGSTDNNRDAWTIGYTPSLAVGVWVGNNENEAMTSGGSALAGPIWRRTMTSFLGDTAREEFARPDGIVEIAVCKDSGLRATGGATNTYNEVFLSGTLPTESCSGGSAPAPIEVPVQTTNDSDGDGVYDDKDLCPNTTAGTSVTAGGCPVASPTTNDSDGDGVNDDKDLCSLTPNGIEVDATGCPLPSTDPTPVTDVLIRPYVRA